MPCAAAMAKPRSHLDCSRSESSPASTGSPRPHPRARPPRTRLRHHAYRCSAPGSRRGIALPKYTMSLLKGMADGSTPSTPPSRRITQSRLDDRTNSSASACARHILRPAEVVYPRQADRYGGEDCASHRLRHWMRAGSAADRLFSRRAHQRRCRIDVHLSGGARMAVDQRRDDGRQMNDYAGRYLGHQRSVTCSGSVRSDPAGIARRTAFPPHPCGGRSRPPANRRQRTARTVSHPTSPKAPVTSTVCDHRGTVTHATKPALRLQGTLRASKRTRSIHIRPITPVAHRNHSPLQVIK